MVESIEELRRICQKRDERYDNAVERFSRKFSIYFTKALLYTGISANQATLLNIIIGIVACIFIAYGSNWHFFIGALILQLWFIFDCVDGEIAHYRGTASITGEYVDRINHIVIDPLIFISMTIGLYNIFRYQVIFAFGFSATTSISLLKLVVYSMHVCVVEEHVHSKGIRTKNRTPTLKNVGIEELKSYLIARTSLIFKIANFMMPRPGLVVAILIASIVDLLIYPIKLGLFTLNLNYLLLIIYGLFLPFEWIGLALLIVKKRSPEKLYETLCRESE